MDDGDEPRALVPNLLLCFSLHPKFTGIHVGDRAAHAMVGLAPIQGLLHALPQHRIVDEFQDEGRAANIIQFSQGFLGLVLPGIGSQLANDRGLRHGLSGERGQYSLHVRPLFDNEIIEHLARRLD